MFDPAITRRPVHPVLWLMAGVMMAFELLFAAVEAGHVTPLLSRWQAYVAFAFFDPVFEMALQGYAVDPRLFWTPLTHAFLHGGWMHLLLNTAAFLGLGHFICSSAGLRAVLLIFAVSAISGALAFALISDFSGPMVGASGAIFGFLGAVTAWQERGLRRAGLDRTVIWQRVLGLVALNALLDLGLGGMLAWEAHLGGFVGGWLMAYACPPRAPARLRPRASSSGW